jgi:radical SAM superfamily enzyme YgiQ (UPF0313 family)
VQPGDVVGIGIHTGNALRGLNIGRLARKRGAWVIYGGIHATLFPGEPRDLGGAHSVVKGDGDVVWSKVLADCAAGMPQPIYEGGRVAAEQFLPARWDLTPPGSYMWASVQTVRGCPKHCSFCSVWRTDGQQPRQRSSDTVIEEIVQLRGWVSDLSRSLMITSIRSRSPIWSCRGSRTIRNGWLSCSDCVWSALT